jgi:hypothetical protein
MKRKLVPLVASLLLLGLAVTARADIDYTFTTTTPAPNGGTISGAFSVPDNAITKGSIQSSDIDSYLFFQTGTNPPFSPFIFSPTLDNQFASSNVNVNPTTGQFAPPFNSLANDIAFLTPGTFPFPSVGFVPTGPNTANFFVTQGVNQEQGSGTFTISGPGQPEVPPLPEPSSILLVGFAGISGLVYLGIRRRSRLWKGNR